MQCTPWTCAPLHQKPSSSPCALRWRRLSAADTERTPVAPRSPALHRSRPQATAIPHRRLRGCCHLRQQFQSASKMSESRHCVVPEEAIFAIPHTALQHWQNCDRRQQAKYTITHQHVCSVLSACKYCLCSAQQHRNNTASMEHGALINCIPCSLKG